MTTDEQEFEVFIVNDQFTAMSEQLKPLCTVLDGVLERLAALEAKAGISGASASSSATAAASDEIHPRLAAYDDHVNRALVPFVSSCTSLGPGMSTIGSHVRSTWDGVRTIVALGCTYKRPSSSASAIAPHLKPCQDAMGEIRAARLDRKFDWHVKAVEEMLASVSWVVMSPPPSTAAFVKETIGASDFWANKIRKEYKGKEGEGASQNHLAFCNALKALINDLAAYLKEHHLSGLAWNPHGKDFVAGSAAIPVAAKAKAPSKPAAPEAAGGIFAELAKKKTGDGSSAAVGLKKVGRDQQTWRKEFQGGAAKPAPPKPAAAKPAPKPRFGASAKPLGPPKLEYQDRGCKWSVENQTKENCEGGVCKVTITDPKQQVYIYKCQDVTVQIEGVKLKSVILDSCTKTGVVFASAISACEVVNCKSIQVQSTGLCPSFSIDKTDGCVIHVTNEAIASTGFVTSKSSEMNVSWVDDKGEITEAPIPEQFQHKISNGSITSDVSELYR